MAESLDGKAALVTGASAGIGRATARELGLQGADVALAARRTDRLTELAEEIEAGADVEALVVPTDVSAVEEVHATVEETAETFGGLDVVVSNAGIGGPDDISTISVEEYHRLMGVNVDGMFYVTTAALPHLRRSSGNLIFVGSFAGQYPRPGNAVYAASKWWTRGFAHSLAGTVGGDGVGVTVVNPTEVRTEIGGGDAAPMQDRYEPGEVTEPETVAAAIAFAARQSSPDVVNELDLYRRDKFEHF